MDYTMPALIQRPEVPLGQRLIELGVTGKQHREHSLDSLEVGEILLAHQHAAQSSREVEAVLNERIQG